MDERGQAPAIGVSWRRSAADDSDELAAARQLIATLTSLPQPPLAPGAALISAAGMPAPSTAARRPLSYRELDLRSDPGSGERQREGLRVPARVTRHRRRSAGPVQAETRGQVRSPAHNQGMRSKLEPPAPEPSRPTGAGAGSENETERERPGGARRAARPGQGGRQPRVSVFTDATATKELYEELGEPEYSTHRGARMYVWRVDPNGDGILLARLSGEELNGGETVMGQVHGVRRMLAEKAPDKRLRYIVVTTNNSGYRRYENRPDFAFIERKVLGECGWIAARETSRLARESLPGELLIDLLRRSKTSLYLVRPVYGKVSWKRDRTQLAFSRVIDESEGHRIKERTHDALINRFLAEGRGWPGQSKLGFRRDEKGFFVPDPEQWPYIEFAHLNYASFAEAEAAASGGGGGGEDGGGEDGRKSEQRRRSPGRGKHQRNSGGLRGLAEALEERGFPISHERLRAMLKDRIYVTGRWHTTWEGREISGRPIELPRPIPEHVFERNQAMLALGLRRKRITPPGTFILNHVEFVCGHCLERGVEPESRSGRDSSRLRAYQIADRERARYLHKPRPDPGCRGTSYPTMLDQVVVDELLRLSSNKLLQREWAERARDDAGPSPSLALDREQKQRIEAQIRSLDQKRLQLTKQFTDKIKANEQVGIETWEAMLDGVTTELKRLHRQLDNADVALPVPDWRRRVSESQEAELAETLAALFEEHPHSDLDIRAHQAAVIQACLSRVVVWRTEDGFRLRLEGEMIPDDDGGAGSMEFEAPVSPAESAQDELNRFRAGDGPVVVGANGLAPYSGVLEQANSGVDDDVDAGAGSGVGVGSDSRGEDVNEASPSLTSFRLHYRDLADPHFVERLIEAGPPNRPVAEWTAWERTKLARPNRMASRAGKGLRPAWISPAIEISAPRHGPQGQRSTMAVGRDGVHPDLDRCLEAIVAVAHQHAHPDQIQMKSYDGFARQDPTLPSAQLIVRIARAAGLSGWCEVRDRAYASDPVLADPHEGLPFRLLAERTGVSQDWLEKLSHSGRLRFYVRFGLRYSTPEWVADSREPR